MPVFNPLLRWWKAVLAPTWVLIGRYRIRTDTLTAYYFVGCTVYFTENGVFRAVELDSENQALSVISGLDTAVELR